MQIKLYSKTDYKKAVAPISQRIGQVDTMDYGTTSSLADSYSCSARQSATRQADTTADRTWYLINRAYQNIYGMNMPGNPPYQQTIFNACRELMRDQRTASISEKHLLQAFEDIIRISDEHHREAQKHLARASNAVYLRETALDNLLEHQKYMSALEELMPGSTVRSWHTAHSGRVVGRRSGTAPTVVDITAEQLALSINNKCQN